MYCGRSRRMPGDVVEKFLYSAIYKYRCNRLMIISTYRDKAKISTTIDNCYL